MKLKSVKPSPNPDKKYRATFERDGREKNVDFGAAGMDDYTKTKDTEQRARYLERHGRGKESWNKPDTAGALSRWLLWGESTSMVENLRRFRSRFNV